MRKYDLQVEVEVLWDEMELKSMRNSVDLPVNKKLDVDSLQKYLEKRNFELGEILSYERVGEGVATVTYYLSSEKGEYVLRHLSATSDGRNINNMQREYQITTVLNAYIKQVPTPYLYCLDSTIIGMPFYLMERKNGTVLHTRFIGNYRREVGRDISEEMINQLVDLHSIDYKQTALKDMFEVDNTLENQVYEWIGRYEQVQNSSNDAVENLIFWLKNNMPTSKYIAISHGNYQLKNTMFNKDLTKLVGLFGFEMTKVGDPLLDLAVMLSYWVTVDDPLTLQYSMQKAPVTIMPGFYSKEELVNRYEQKSGRQMSHFNYYMVFAYFQMAVRVQQDYLVYKEWAPTNTYVKQMARQVSQIMNYAISLIK